MLGATDHCVNVSERNVKESAGHKMYMYQTKNHGSCYKNRPIKCSTRAQHTPCVKQIRTTGMVNAHMNHANAHTSLLAGEPNEVRLELVLLLLREFGVGSPLTSCFQ